MRKGSPNGGDKVKISAALAQTGQVFLDTAPLIFLVEANPSYLDLMRAVFEMIENGQLRAITSPISLAECLIHPIRQSNVAAINTFTNLITSGANTSFVSIGEVVARRAAELRVMYKFKLPDSLQLATEIESGCESFLTNDHQLSQVSEINVIVIDDMELD